MSQPTPYNKATNFTEYAANNPADKYPAALLDAELAAAERTVDETLVNLALIQRDDGKIRNEAVHPDSLSTATKALMSGWNPRGLWQTGTLYAAKDMVEKDGASYVCVTAHVSGTFTTDYNASKWSIVSPAQYQVVDTIAGLKALFGSQLAGSVIVLGYHSAGDGGGGLFRYNVSDATADNGGTVIAPSAGAGRWNRVYDMALNVKWFGAVGDGIEDDTAAFTAAAAAGNQFVPAGSYKITGTVTGNFWSDGDVTIVGGTVNYITENVAKLAQSVGASLVGFVQSGSGAVATTQQARGRLEIWAEDFGVVADDAATDQSTKLQAALDAAQARAHTGSIHGCDVRLSDGVVGVGAQIVVPSRVRIVGSGKRSSEIKATSSFPASTPVVRLGQVGGESSGAVFDCALVDMSVNCNNISGSIGVYGTDIQDGCGCVRVVIRGYVAKGYHFDASAGTFGSINRYILEDCEAYTNSTNSDMIGLHIKGPNLWPGKIISYSTECQPATTGADGILLENGHFLLYDVYCGYYADGVDWGSAAFGGIFGVVGNTCTDVVQNSTGTSIVVTSASRANGTNTINDIGNAITITDSHIAYYSSDEVYARAFASPQRTTAALSAGNNNNVSDSFRGSLRLTPNASGSTITGLVARASGQRCRITNIGTAVLTLAHENTNSTAANRIISPTGADLRLQPEDVVELEYDTTTARWRILWASDVRTATTSVTAASGATVTATNLIPAGAVLLGVNTEITTALGTTNGTTGYNVGDGSDADRFGVAAAVIAGTATDNADATADPTGWSASARSVVLTAVGGNFDGTGVVRVTARYFGNM